MDVASIKMPIGCYWGTRSCWKLCNLAAPSTINLKRLKLKAHFLWSSWGAKWSECKLQASPVHRNLFRMKRFRLQTIAHFSGSSSSTDLLKRPDTRPCRQFHQRIVESRWCWCGSPRKSLCNTFACGSVIQLPAVRRWWKMSGMLRPILKPNFQRLICGWPGPKSNKGKSVSPQFPYLVTVTSCQWDVSLCANVRPSVST